MPGPTTAPAPTKPYFFTVAPSRMHAPMPITHRSSMVQAWRMVAARVDAHAVDVAADHRAGPHRHVLAQSHVADEGAGRIHVGACAELG
ncbi:hypothetical protein ATB53_13270 [Xanthomonas translucens]|uniref:Uncharacterized protein n=1 Tax=Xanthomonas campestris pv. translucens TaxID=343 RepID=A0A109HM11_XANCT|nr:hypothetical protein ATB53_13270 [Xanthomonas translucens]